ncbi:MAG: nucleotidyltransferase domain-containing protein [Desulfuromonadaceae bacterium]|nr:nucleotidyltransferase domain-containing protein [Desulfuromonadaceae bacterium]MDD2855123.1 nucleotidyltransferase domain-containing protein [Desulfuromonadaceae bacterium]
MIKQNRMPIDVSGRLNLLEPLLSADSRILFAYIFGGLASGIQQPLSDVDIAVYLDGCVDKAEAKLDILGCISAVLKTDEIDLVILNDAPISLVGRIMRKKLLIADKQPFLRHKFESLALRQFFDFSRTEQDILFRRFA